MSPPSTTFEAVRGKCSSLSLLISVLTEAHNVVDETPLTAVANVNTKFAIISQLNQHYNKITKRKMRQHSIGLT